MSLSSLLLRCNLSPSLVAYFWNISMKMFMAKSSLPICGPVLNARGEKSHSMWFTHTDTLNREGNKQADWTRLRVTLLTVKGQQNSFYCSKWDGTGSVKCMWPPDSLETADMLNEVSAECVIITWSKWLTASEIIKTWSVLKMKNIN